MRLRTRVGALYALAALIAVAVPAGAAPPDPVAVQSPTTVSAPDSPTLTPLPAVVPSFVLMLDRTDSVSLQVARQRAQRMCDSLTVAERRWRFDGSRSYRTRPPTVQHATYLTTTVFADSTTAPALRTRPRLRGSGDRPSASPAPRGGDSDSATSVRLLCALSRTLRT